MNYSNELKESILHRLLPPNSESVTKVARKEGISEQILRNWRDKAREEGHPAPDGGQPGKNKGCTLSTALWIRVRMPSAYLICKLYGRKEQAYDV